MLSPFLFRFLFCGSTPKIVKVWYNVRMETKISGLTKLFEQSIGIVEPWYIRKTRI